MCLVLCILRCPAIHIKKKKKIVANNTSVLFIGPGIQLARQHSDANITRQPKFRPPVCKPRNVDHLFSKQTNKTKSSGTLIAYTHGITSAKVLACNICSNYGLCTKIVSYTYYLCCTPSTLADDSRETTPTTGIEFTFLGLWRETQLGQK